MPTPSKWVWTDDRQPEVVACAPHRVVHGVAVGDPRPAGEEHADELVAPADAADLGRGGLGVLGGDDDQAAQSRFGLEPVLEQPVVVGPRELRGEDAVRDDRERRRLVGREDPVGELERLEDVRPHLVERLADESARRPPCSAVEGVVAAASRSGGTRGSSASRARSCRS